MSHRKKALSATASSMGVVGDDLNHTTPYPTLPLPLTSSFSSSSTPLPTATTRLSLPWIRTANANSHVVSKREGHCATSLGHSVFVFGGIEAGVRVNSLLAFDGIKCAWKVVENNNDSLLRIYRGTTESRSSSGYVATSTNNISNTNTNSNSNSHTNSLTSFGLNTAALAVTKIVPGINNGSGGLIEVSSVNKIIGAKATTNAANTSNNNNNNNNGIISGAISVDKKSLNGNKSGSSSGLTSRWNDVRNIPTPRAYSATCTIGGRFIVIFGGEGPLITDASLDNNSDYSIPTPNTIDNTAINTSTAAVGLTSTTGLALTQSGLPSPNPLLFACPNDTIGGYTKASTRQVNIAKNPVVCLNDVYVFDTLTKLYVRLPCNNTPLPRKGHTMTIVTGRGLSLQHKKNNASTSTSKSANTTNNVFCEDDKSKDAEDEYILLFGGYNRETSSVADSVHVCRCKDIIDYMMKIIPLEGSQSNSSKNRGEEGEDGLAQRPMTLQDQVNIKALFTLETTTSIANRVTWSVLPCGPTSNKSPLLVGGAGAAVIGVGGVLGGGGGPPAGRYGHSCSFLKIKEVPHIAIFGGSDGMHQAKDDFYVLNLNTLNWSHIWSNSRSGSNSSSCSSNGLVPKNLKGHAAFVMRSKNSYNNNGTSSSSSSSSSSRESDCLIIFGGQSSSNDLSPSSSSSSSSNLINRSSSKDSRDSRQLFVCYDFDSNVFSDLSDIAGLNPPGPFIGHTLNVYSLPSTAAAQYGLFPLSSSEVIGGGKGGDEVKDFCGNSRDTTGLNLAFVFGGSSSESSKSLGSVSRNERVGGGAISDFWCLNLKWTQVMHSNEVEGDMGHKGEEGGGVTTKQFVESSAKSNKTSVNIGNNNKSSTTINTQILAKSNSDGNIISCDNKISSVTNSKHIDILDNKTDVTFAATIKLPVHEQVPVTTTSSTSNTNTAVAVTAGVTSSPSAASVIATELQQLAYSQQGNYINFDYGDDDNDDADDTNIGAGAGSQINMLASSKRQINYTSSFKSDHNNGSNNATSVNRNLSSSSTFIDNNLVELLQEASESKDSLLIRLKGDKVKLDASLREEQGVLVERKFEVARLMEDLTKLNEKYREDMAMIFAMSNPDSSSGVETAALEEICKQLQEELSCRLKRERELSLLNDELRTIIALKGIEETYEL